MPTRVILDGGPDLGTGPLAERAAHLARDHKTFCSAVLSEPRGKPGMVAALLVPPLDPTCVTGVIYFDVGAVLGMCGHGTIGLGVTLARVGRIEPGRHRIETPAGVVTIDLHDPNTVTVINIESRLVKADVTISTPDLGEIIGDVAYGGNWFFIVDPSPIPVLPANIRALTDAAITLRTHANALEIGGERGEPIDHVIFQGNDPDPMVHSRNFVLCPDNTYDRSPCGTGSSARLACLSAKGQLEPGQEIRQNSIIGSGYDLSCEPGPNGGVIPRIRGRAHVMAEGRLIFEDTDPFKSGIPR
jgi:proline racemase/4-hydroxyproline epimerase